MTAAFPTLFALSVCLIGYGIVWQTRFESGACFVVRLWVFLNLPASRLSHALFRETTFASYFGTVFLQWWIVGMVVWAVACSGVTLFNRF